MKRLDLARSGRPPRGRPRQRNRPDRRGRRPGQPLGRPQLVDCVRGRLGVGRRDLERQVLERQQLERQVLVRRRLDGSVLERAVVEWSGLAGTIVVQRPVGPLSELVSET